MGLGDLTEPLWDFITDTWVPRGTESARLLYNASGWTAFTNLNIFGATGYALFNPGLDTVALFASNLEQADERCIVVGCAA